MSQDYRSDYKPLQCTGKLPSIFTTAAFDSYLIDKEALSASSDDEATLRSKKEFYLRSNYSIVELLNSGRVLFGDPISNYVNDVGRSLIQDEPELLSKIQFYVMRSSSFNAISTESGVIIVNLGLIAKLNNEAELAFVLAHEIEHYAQHHNLEGFVENDKLRKGRGEYYKATYEEKIEALYGRSKATEMEADSLGIIRYLKHGYDPQYVFSIQSTMHYAYLPFYEAEFDHGFLNSMSFKVPECFFPDSVAQINSEEDYKDEYLTHANTAKRKALAERMMKDSKSGVANKLDYDRLEKIREIARFESVQLDIQAKSYGRAIFNAYLLLKKYPENRYLHFAVAKAMYDLARYKNADQFQRAAASFTKTQGTSQKVHFALRQFTIDQINAMAISRIESFIQKFGPNETILNMENDLLIDAILVRSRTIEELIQPFEPPTELEINLAIEKRGISGSSKIKRYSQSLYKEFWKGCLSSLEDKSRFVTAFDKAKIEAEERSAFHAMSHSERVTQEFREENNLHKEGLKLSNKKVILIDPYLVYSTSLNREQDYSTSDVKRDEFLANIFSAADQQKVPYQTISSHLFNENDVSRVNEMNLLKQWIQERYSHEMKDYTPQYSEFVKDIIQSYGTPNILYTGLYISKQTGNSYFYFGLLNLESGEVIREYDEVFTTAGNAALTKAQKSLLEEFKIISL